MEPVPFRLWSIAISSGQLKNYSLLAAAMLVLLLAIMLFKPESRSSG
jgi:hypothetical protein